jgi:MFS family permease
MKPSSYRRYLLGVLAIILAFNGLDRIALGIVLQDIKIDLALTDSQLGLLTGIAFALFYSVMGLPISRWADLGNRVTIISVTTALWSVGVALCGMAASYLQLLSIRVGVAVGEAGCLPPALSLIADYYVRAERPRAIALYLQGGSLSIVVGYFMTGWLNQFYGWRMTFILLGLPGLCIAMVAWCTLKEPRRTKRPAIDLPDSASRRVDPTVAQEVLPSQPSFKEVCAALWAKTAFRHLLIFYSIGALFNFGIVQWQPTFLIRSYGLKTGELGTWIAAVCGSGTIIGTYLGGEWATRGAANNEGLQLKVMAIAYCSCGLVASCVFLAPNRYWAFGCMGVWNVVCTMTTAPVLATIQTLVPERMRATAVTLLLLCASLVGTGVGPLAAGTLSDALRPLAGEESLRYALLMLCPGYLWGGWHLWRASDSVTREINAMHASHLV